MINEARSATLGQPEQLMQNSLQDRLGSSTARTGVENHREPNTTSEAQDLKVTLGQAEQSVPYSLQARLGHSSARADGENKSDAGEGATEKNMKRTLQISPKIAGLRRMFSKVTQNSKERNPILIESDKSIDENVVSVIVNEKLTGNMTGNLKKDLTEKNMTGRFSTGRLDSSKENLVTDSIVVVEEKNDRKWTSPFNKNVVGEDLQKIDKKKEIAVKEWKKIFDSPKTNEKEVLKKQKIPGKKNLPKRTTLSSSEEMCLKPKKLRTPMKSKIPKGGGGLKKDNKPQDDQREFKLFRSSNGLKFFKNSSKILQKFKDGD